MKFSILFFILLLACMCPVLAQGSYENCCLKYVTGGIKKSTKRRVEKYRRQETDGGCNRRAVVFTLRSLRTFCADPEQPWVKNLISDIDRRSKRNTM